MSELRPRTLALHRLRGVLHNELTRTIAMRAWRDAFQRVLSAARPDVIHVHNLHAAGWDVEIVETCLEHAPVVWTMHDMWPVTGSCAHPLDCTGYKTRCDARCPQSGQYPTLPSGMVAAAQERRRRLFRQGSALHLTAPSEWLVKLAREVVPDRVAIQHIPNVLDTERFRPREQRAPRDPPALLAVATDLDVPGKGSALLMEALARLKMPLELRLLGEARSHRHDDKRVRYLGAQPEEGVADAMRAADLFVHPSVAEAEGQAVREAMACGLPVVALPVGPMRELIGATGWIAEDSSSLALARALEDALTRRSLWEAKGRVARERALARSSPSRTVAPFESLYRRMAGMEAMSP